MPSPEANRRNLEQAHNPWTERSRDESLMIWRLTFDWWMTPRPRRDAKTQRAWAKQLEVSQPYVAKMVRRFKRESPNREFLEWRTERPPVTLEELRRGRERRLDWATRPYEQQLGASVAPTYQSVLRPDQMRLLLDCPIVDQLV